MEGIWAELQEVEVRIDFCFLGYMLHEHKLFTLTMVVQND